MAEEQNNKTEPEHKTEAKKGKKPLALVGIVILLAVAAATVWVMRHRTVSAAAPEHVEVKPKAILHLESFIVNLADRDEKTFLRVGLDLGIAKEANKKEGGSPAETTPPVRDAVIGVLTACKADDLLTVEGKQALKANLVKSLNERVPELQVQEIYFTEFLVQR